MFCNLLSSALLKKYFSRLFFRFWQVLSILSFPLQKKTLLLWSSIWFYSVDVKISFSFILKRVCSWMSTNPSAAISVLSVCFNIVCYHFPVMLSPSVSSSSSLCPYSWLGDLCHISSFFLWQILNYILLNSFYLQKYLVLACYGARLFHLSPKLSPIYTLFLFVPESHGCADHLLQKILLWLYFIFAHSSKLSYMYPIYCKILFTLTFGEKESISSFSYSCKIPRCPALEYVEDMQWKCFYHMHVYWIVSKIKSHLFLLYPIQQDNIFYLYKIVISELTELIFLFCFYICPT